MGPKEFMMIGAGLLVLVAVLFVTNWVKSRSGNSNAHKNQP